MAAMPSITSADAIEGIADNSSMIMVFLKRVFIVAL
jgi:hypothetical protein